jgi:hypothetical protein
MGLSLKYAKVETLFMVGLDIKGSVSEQARVPAKGTFFITQGARLRSIIWLKAFLVAKSTKPTIDWNGFVCISTVNVPSNNDSNNAS